MMQETNGVKGCLIRPSHNPVKVGYSRQIETPFWCVRSLTDAVNFPDEQYALNAERAFLAAVNEFFEIRNLGGNADSACKHQGTAVTTKITSVASASANHLDGLGQQTWQDCTAVRETVPHSVMCRGAI
jgi:hypothetical protein